MARITHIAFLLALVVIIARLTTPDSLRDPWNPTPGGDVLPAAPGPATALIFDLLACIPAVLVLTRRAIDRDYRLAFRASHLLLVTLAVWMVLSTAWSADRFAAAVTSAHFFAASCLFWAMSQLVRSAGRLRMVSALAFGLLLLLVAQSVIYRFVDVPENLHYWAEKKEDILKSHNWAPDSFAARQFEQKVTSGELVGLFNSPNSVAAVGVLLFFACIGIGIQKLHDKDPPEWLILPIVSAIALIWILISARSKTSAATPFVGLGVLSLMGIYRGRLRDHRRLAFLAGTGLVAFAIIAVVGHGMYHHGLFAGHFGNSLDFRWKYWVASAGIFFSHPWIGVGWNNFGLHYLSHRLPEAAEEIKDPHNFLVRFFVELGIVGGLLAIAWLIRSAWELTGPREERGDGEDRLLTIRSIVVTVLLGMILSVLVNVDFSLPLADTLALLMKPMLYALALLLGTIAAAMRAPSQWSLDSRPAPWVFYSLVTALGIFLLHNLIDFSWFEAGALFPFMAMVGAAQGMLSPGRIGQQSRALSISTAIAAMLGLAAAGVFFVIPIVIAEQTAQAGDEMIRTAASERSDVNGMHFRAAAAAFASSASLVPYNADYLFRQAQALASVGDFDRARSVLVNARHANPLLIDGYLLDANLQLSLAHPDASAVRADFESILRLNPNDVSLRIQFGQALDRFGLHSDAREQYQKALNSNAALPAGEPKRLPPEKIGELQDKMANDGSKARE